MPSNLPIDRMRRAAAAQAPESTNKDQVNLLQKILNALLGERKARELNTAFQSSDAATRRNAQARLAIGMASGAGQFAAQQVRTPEFQKAAVGTAYGVAESIPVVGPFAKLARPVLKPAANRLLQATSKAAEARISALGQAGIAGVSGDLREEERREDLRKLITSSTYYASDPRALGRGEKGLGSKARQKAAQTLTTELENRGYDEQARMSLMGQEKTRFGGTRAKALDLSGLDKELAKFPSEGKADREARKLEYVAGVLVKSYNDAFEAGAKIRVKPLDDTTKAVNQLAAQEKGKGGLAQGLIIGSVMKLVDTAVSGVTQSLQSQYQSYQSVGQLQQYSTPGRVNTGFNSGVGKGGYFQQIVGQGETYGYTDEQSAQAAASYLGSVGRMSGSQASKQLSDILKFSDVQGMDYNQWAAQMGQAGSLGFMGTSNTLGTQQFRGMGGFQNFLGAQYAATGGLAKMPDFTQGLFDVSRIMQATTAAPAEITSGGAFSAANLYTTMNMADSRGNLNPALAGGQGAALMGQLSTGITNSPNTGAAGMAWYNLLQSQGGGQLTPAQLEYVKEGGLTATTIGKHTYDPLEALYQGFTKGQFSQMDPYTKASVFQSLVPGMNERQAQVLIGGYDAHGKMQPGILGKLHSRPEYMNRWKQYTKGINLADVNATSMQAVAQLASGTDIHKVEAQYHDFLKANKIDTKGLNAQGLAQRLLHVKPGDSEAKIDRKVMNDFNIALGKATQVMKGFVDHIPGGITTFGLAVTGLVTGLGVLLKGRGIPGGGAIKGAFNFLKNIGGNILSKLLPGGAVADAAGDAAAAVAASGAGTVAAISSIPLSLATIGYGALRLPSQINAMAKNTKINEFLSYMRQTGSKGWSFQGGSGPLGVGGSKLSFDDAHGGHYSFGINELDHMRVRADGQVEIFNGKKWEAIPMNLPGKPTPKPHRPSAPGHHDPAHPHGTPDTSRAHHPLYAEDFVLKLIIEDQIAHKTTTTSYKAGRHKHTATDVKVSRKPK